MCVSSIQPALETYHLYDAAALAPLVFLKGHQNHPIYGYPMTCPPTWEWHDRLTKMDGLSLDMTSSLGLGILILPFFNY